MAEGSGAAAAQSYREHMRAKANRLGDGEDAKNVDASDFTPAEKIYAGVKTGMRPVSRQARKDGGAVQGMCAGGNPGRSPRKKGGGIGESYVNRDSKAADEDRSGHYPNGGMKKGGRAHKAGGGLGGLGALGGLLPMAISEMSGGDDDDQKPGLAPAAPKANGGYLPREGGPSLGRELRKKSASGALDTSDRPAAEDGRQGRASGGRVSRQAGGPLATPLAAGMGGQGRMSFNYGPQASEATKLGLRDGGRAKAHERYGAGPGHAEHHPGMASGGRAARAAGGSVEKKVLAAHHAEHEAMKEGRKDGGSVTGPPKAAIKRAVAAIQPRQAPSVPFNIDDTMAAARYQRGHSEKGGKVGHGKDCDCPRCAARKAKGGLLKDWDAKRRADGGSISTAAREKAEAKGETMPGGSFPIRNEQDLKNAKQAVGRAKSPTKARAWIDKRAKALGEPPLGGMAEHQETKRRAAHAHGGKAGKGKMSVNIVIAPGGANPQPPVGAGPPGPPPGGPMRPPGMPLPMPGGAPPPAAGPPMPIPMPMPGGAPGAAGMGGMPPSPMRKRGGRVKAGAGSGLGRLAKIRAYGEPPTKGQSV